MSVLKFHGAITTSLDSAATIDVPADGKITGILMNVNIAGADALGDGGAIEVSFGSSNTFSVNDSRQSICGLSVTNHFLTSGGGLPSTNNYTDIRNLPVFAGERIHVHTVAIGGATVGFDVWMYIDDKVDAKPASRRR